MPQSLSQVWLHIVFSTKDRQAFLQNPEFRDEMFRMLSHHVSEIGCFPKRSGGWNDHVHVVLGLARTVTIAQLVENVKTETSRWAKKVSGGSKSFTWQAGYGVFFSQPVQSGSCCCVCRAAGKAPSDTDVSG